MVRNETSMFGNETSYMNMYIHVHVCLGIGLVHVCLGMRLVHVHVRVHDVIGDVERKKERKKESNGKMKMRVASGGIQTHDTLYSRQMLYQLSYQGSSAGRVRHVGLGIELVYICLGMRLVHVHVHISTTFLNIQHVVSLL